MPTPVSAVSDQSAARKAVEEAIERHRAEPLAAELTPRGLGPYRGYAELLEEVLRLCTQNGRSARLTLAGRSVRGEPLVALHLGNPAPTERSRTSVIVAGLHPIEWIGIESALGLLKRLSDTDFGERSLVAFPIANPDGLLKVERNLRRGHRRFVRHNARGVDLNRNFDTGWGHKNLIARLVPWVFKPGSYAASEPEVAAIAYALGARRVDRALSFHSFGGVVLYPSGRSLFPIPDAAEHRAWAKSIGERAASRPYTALPTSWFGFGMTMGGLELDWFHERHGALSLLIECSRPSLGRRAKRLLDPFGWFNPPSPDRVANKIARAAVPFVRGDATPP